MTGWSPSRAAAVILSLIAPGMGHYYCGRRLAGMLILASYHIVFASSAFLWALVEFNFVLLFAFIFVFSTAYWTAAAVKAYSLAGKAHTDTFRIGGLGAWLPCLAAAIAFGLGSSTVVRKYLVETLTASSGSMEPAIEKGDVIVINKTYGWLRNAAKGDVVVFLTDAETEGRLFVKRIVALAGEKAPTAGFPETEVPEGSVFVAGDNARNSLDSRIFGPVRVSSIVGKAVSVFYSRENGTGRAGELIR